MRPRGLGVVVVVVGVLGVGCSDDEPGTETTQVDGREVFVLEAPDCDDESSCGFALAIDGRLYSPIRCVDPSLPESSLGQLIAVARSDRPSYGYREARAIVGTQQTEAVAVLEPEDLCGDDTPGRWIRAGRAD